MTKQRDPLVLDLDKDGIETTNVRGRAHFDQDANGFAEQTGWVQSDDGLLVFDRNGDYTINDGSELFGNETVMSNGKKATNGFEALADLDANRDGQIDAQDAAYSLLRVWRDLDGNGYSFVNELFGLDELGVKSINLQSTVTGTTDPQGNTQDRVGSFTWTDGSTGQIAEYTFATNTAYTIATEWVDVPDDIAALPDLPGYGVVPRLQQAMARDTAVNPYPWCGVVSRP